MKCVPENAGEGGVGGGADEGDDEQKEEEEARQEQVGRKDRYVRKLGRRPELEEFK